MPAQSHENGGQVHRGWCAGNLWQSSRRSSRGCSSSRSRPRTVRHTQPSTREREQENRLPRMLPRQVSASRVKSRHPVWSRPRRGSLLPRPGIAPAQDKVLRAGRRSVDRKELYRHARQESGTGNRARPCRRIRYKRHGGCHRPAPGPDVRASPGPHCLTHRRLRAGRESGKTTPGFPRDGLA